MSFGAWQPVLWVVPVRSGGGGVGERGGIKSVKCFRAWRPVLWVVPMGSGVEGGGIMSVTCFRA